MIRWIGMVSVLLASSTLAFAHCGTCGQQGHSEKQGIKEHMKESQLERMTEKLGLTPEQQAQAKAILEEKESRIEQVRQESRDKIKALLTDDQKSRFDQMKMKGHGKMCPEGCDCPSCANNGDSCTLCKKGDTDCKKCAHKAGKKK